MIRSLACAVVLLALNLPGVSQAQETGPKITIDGTSRNFGTVPRGTVVSETFTIRNLGTETLLLKGLQFSEHGMKAKVRQAIEPGQSAELNLTWDTKQHSREVEGKAMLELNDPKSPRIMLTLSGIVVSPIDVLPVPAVYLSQFQGESGVQSIVIRNNQEHDIAVTGIERNGESYSADIETVEAGREYRVTVSALPNAPIGRLSERFFVYIDDPKRKRIAIEVNILVKPDVFMTTEFVDFGTVDIKRLRRDLSLLDLMKQSFIITRRSGEMRITGARSDLPFITFVQKPREASQTFRVDAGLDPEKLTVGLFQGFIQLATDDPRFPELTLPVRITVEE